MPDPCIRLLSIGASKLPGHCRRGLPCVEGDPVALRAALAAAIARGPATIEQRGRDRYHSDFQLIAGTNRDLAACVAAGTFRDDLYARLNLWTFTMPGLAERREDIAPNLDYELDRHAEREGDRITFNKEARNRYLAFATGAAARWPGNFRDLAASVTRMATFSPSGRINIECVAAEIARLKRLWTGGADATDPLGGLLPPEQLDGLDPFDRVQLAHVVATCRASRSLSDAGRSLFAASRRQRTSTNDADRLRKYLARFGLSWADLTM